MAISCEKCNGACCQGILCGIIGEGTSELFELRGLRVIDRYVYTPPCRYLNPEGHCSMYSMRPQACKDFEPGCEMCLLMRRLWFRESETQER
jgi:Fe-S-cluster containining protein